MNRYACHGIDNELGALFLCDPVLTRYAEAEVWV